MSKHRFSRGAYDKIGAIIIGTKDCKKCDKLYFADMRRLMAQHKQSQSEDNTQ